MNTRRKIATFLVILTVLLLSAFVLTGCGEEKPACVHEWTEATCEAPRTCSLCGATEGAALGHTGGTATCTARATCEVCGKEYGELAAHTGGTATCKERATCTVCGEKYGELAAHTGGTATCTKKATCEVCGKEYGNLAAHNWKEATCEAPRTCLTCGATEGTKLAHKGGKATCKAKAVCELCGKEYGELGSHAGGTATCQEKATCTTCGEKYGDLAGHNWKEATCEAPRTCKVCGVTEGEKLGHTGGTATCTKKATCTRCGKEYGDLLAHEWEAATCETPKSCKNCTATEGEKLGHTGGTATCTKKATCTRCGKEYGDLVAHDWTEATCTAPKTCNVCGKTEGNALGHTGGTATCTKKAICTRCEKEYGDFGDHTGGTATCKDKAVCSVCHQPYGELSAEHNYVAENCGDEYTCSVCQHKNGKTKQHIGGTATCTERAVCDNCHQPYGDLAAHDWTEATCTAPRSCKNCDATEGDALGHTGGTATCTKKAICTRCGKEYGDLADHDWTEATCTAPRSCKNCDATEGDALGHTGGEATCAVRAICERCKQEYGDLADTHEWLDATCTAPKTCNICHKTDGEELGHTGGTATCLAPAICERCHQPYGEMGSHVIVDATCDAPAHCARAGCNYSSGEPLGHDWSEATCIQPAHCKREGCQAVGELGDHTGGKATCKEQAICEVCHQPYGELSAEHNYVAENCGDEYTCSVCGDKNGKTKQHTGGTATCTERALCDNCHQPYGDLTRHQYAAAKCGDEYACSVCGDKNGKIREHRGGTATCTEQATCIDCHEKYGNYAAHDWDEATCDAPMTCRVCHTTEGEKLSHKGGTATCKDKAVCDLCGKEYGEPGSHTGGTATCKDKAVCSVCGEKYGEYGDHIMVDGVCSICGEGGECKHEYTETVVKPTCTKGGYTLHKCTKCDNSYRSDPTSALGHTGTDICDRCREDISEHTQMKQFLLALMDNDVVFRLNGFHVLMPISGNGTLILDIRFAEMCLYVDANGQLAGWGKGTTQYLQNGISTDLTVRAVIRDGKIYVGLSGTDYVTGANYDYGDDTRTHHETTAMNGEWYATVDDFGQIFGSGESATIIGQMVLSLPSIIKNDVLPILRALIETDDGTMSKTLFWLLRQVFTIDRSETGMNLTISPVKLLAFADKLHDKTFRELAEEILGEGAWKTFTDKVTGWLNSTLNDAIIALNERGVTVGMIDRLLSDVSGLVPGGQTLTLPKDADTLLHKTVAGWICDLGNAGVAEDSQVTPQQLVEMVTGLLSSTGNKTLCAIIADNANASSGEGGGSATAETVRDAIRTSLKKMGDSLYLSISISNEGTFTAEGKLVLDENLRGTFSVIANGTYVSEEDYDAFIRKAKAMTGTLTADALAKAAADSVKHTEKKNDNGDVIEGTEITYDPDSNTLTQREYYWTWMTSGGVPLYDKDGTWMNQVNFEIYGIYAHIYEISLDQIIALMAADDCTGYRAFQIAFRAKYGSRSTIEQAYVYDRENGTMVPVDYIKTETGFRLEFKDGSGRYAEGEYQLSINENTEWRDTSFTLTLLQKVNTGVATVCEDEFCILGDADSTRHIWQLDEEIPATGCNTPGERHYRCTVCGATYTRYVYLKHSLSETPEYERFGEDCDKDGYRVIYRCTDCGEIVESYTTYGHRIVNGKCILCGREEETGCKHEYTKSKTMQEPTCEINGYAVWICEKCGEEVGEVVIDALGHNMVEGKCSRCGYTEGETGCTHDSVVIETIEKPSCEKEGYGIRVCESCGKKVGEVVIPAPGHDMVAGRCSRCGYTTVQIECEHEYTGTKTVQEPTCDTDGYAVKVCGKCGAEGEKILLPAPGHNMVEGKCSRCGYEETPACEHDYTSVTVDATCTRDGYVLHECTKCKDSYKTDFTSALGHTGTDTCERCGKAMADVARMKKFLLALMDNDMVLTMNNFNLLIPTGEDGKLQIDIHFIELNFYIAEDGQLAGWGSGTTRYTQDGITAWMDVKAVFRDGRLYIMIEADNLTVEGSGSGYGKSEIVTASGTWYLDVDGFDAFFGGNVAEGLNSMVEILPGVLKNDLLPVLRRLIETDDGEITKVLFWFAEQFFSITRDGDGTSLTLSMENLMAFNEKLSRKTFRALAEEILGEGAWNNFSKKVGDILGSSLTAFLARLNERGVTQEMVDKLLSDLSTLFFGDADFLALPTDADTLLHTTVAGWVCDLINAVKSEDETKITAGDMISQWNQMSEALGDTTLYQMIADSVNHQPTAPNEERVLITPDDIRDRVDPILEQICGMISVSARIGNDGILTADVRIDISMEGTSVSGCVRVETGYQSGVDYDAVIRGAQEMSSRLTEEALHQVLSLMNSHTETPDPDNEQITVSKSSSYDSGNNLLTREERRQGYEDLGRYPLYDEKGDLVSNLQYRRVWENITVVETDFSRLLAKIGTADCEGYVRFLLNVSGTRKETSRNEIQVFDEETQTWQTASEIPEKLAHMLSGGYDSTSTYTTAMVAVVNTQTGEITLYDNASFSGTLGDESTRHTWELKDEKAAEGCTGVGEKIYTCSACGAQYTVHYTNGHHNISEIYDSHGDCEKDGYTVRYVCGDCDEVIRTFEAFGHINSEVVVDLASYGFCEEHSLVGYGCKVCRIMEHVPGGLPITVLESSENKNYVTGYYHCEQCALLVIQKDVREGTACVSRRTTYVQICRGGVSEEGQPVITEELLTYSSTETWDSHDYQETYRLLKEDGTCEDGLVYEARCTRCHKLAPDSGEIYYEHRKCLLENRDLTPYGTDGGYIRVYGCPCGENGFSWDIDGVILERTSYEFPDSIDPEDPRRFADDVCLFTFVRNLKVLVYRTCYELDESCCEVNRLYFLIGFDETTTEAADTVVYETKTHNFRHELEIVRTELTGESCLDGVKIYRKCQRCGYEPEPETVKDHFMRMDIISLEGYLVAEDAYIRTWKCACGKVASYEFFHPAYENILELEDGDLLYVFPNGDDTFYIRSHVIAKAAEGCYSACDYQWILGCDENGAATENSRIVEVSMRGYTHEIEEIYDRTPTAVACVYRVHHVIRCTGCNEVLSEATYYDVWHGDDSLKYGEETDEEGNRHVYNEYCSVCGDGTVTVYDKNGTELERHSQSRFANENDGTVYVNGDSRSYRIRNGLSLLDDERSYTWEYDMETGEKTEIDSCATTFVYWWQEGFADLVKESGSAYTEGSCAFIVVIVNGKGSEVMREFKYGEPYEHMYSQNADGEDVCKNCGERKPAEEISGGKETEVPTSTETVKAEN